MVTDRRRLLRGFLLAPWMSVVAPVSAAVTASDATSPVGGDYVRPEWLADAGWLREHLANPRVRVVALTPADAYEAAHIPGAVQIDWPDLEVIDTSDP